ncbi:hypothetical protein GR160_07240 [Flavobacterium sp. Sd200]|uniref:hypothetical protein n=1 Tax=Flavobacterium sp. Sd200 TaxID=2692211 RepID=UPI00136D04ED|nr:hypothetical protein [Flavobacterium sp. Sd200]MXN91020.1 hypothetical protein [Flavobacterium sp. Sd200]
MKTNIYLVLIAVATLVSCTSENITENVNPSQQNQLTLQRVETYYPSKDFYENSTATIPTGKTVQYFEDGFIVADSTFNSHSLISTTVRSLTATSASQIVYNTSNEAIETYHFTYDNSGRITELSAVSSVSNYRKTITYAANGNASVTYHNEDNGTSENIGTYIANQDGLFTQLNATNENQSLVFEGDKPVTYLQSILDSNTIINMEYYNVAVPENRLKTTTQINNITVVGKLIDSVAQNSNFYLKSVLGIYNNESEFNSLNYITHNMYYDLINNGTTETYYYYNE